MSGPCIVIGGSAGGLRAASEILASLPPSFASPVIVVLHQSSDSTGRLAQVLGNHCALEVKEAEDKERIRGGVVYVAPPDYHLLVERDRSFSLSLDDRVSFARPSVDVLFETAAEAFGPELIAVLLSGANRDGTDGMSRVRHFSGTTLAQDPRTAEVPLMPQLAIGADVVDRVVALEDIAGAIHDEVAKRENRNARRSS